MGYPPEPDAIDARIGAALIRYLEQHPQAMDTAEGITEWWMTAEDNSDVETVRRVLRQLTGQGVLEQVGSSNYVHYRLKQRTEQG